MRTVDLVLYAGTFAFAMTGALKARSYRMDFVGAMVLGFVSAYGGGTLRDLLIGAPVNWLNDNAALALVVSAVLMVYLLKNDVHQFKRILFLTDALGIGMFTVGGLEIAAQHGLNPVYAILMGVITATFGGLLADVFTSKIPDLLKSGELYATACLIGGTAYTLLALAGLDERANLIASVALIVAVRIYSKVNKLKLPYI
ncbi:MAG TPA: trimeric intracellular cation channel family protein [Burkholderiaceae bacterium]